MTGLALVELARRAGTDVDVLARVLDAEVELGRISVDGDGRYSLVAHTFDVRVLTALRAIESGELSVEHRKAART